MSQDQIDIFKRALAREKQARKAAEKILEEKSRELYATSQKLEHLLDEKSSQLQGIFENIVDAYVVMDLSGNVIRFNDAAITLFGYDIHKESINVVDGGVPKHPPKAIIELNKVVLNDKDQKLEPVVVSILLFIRSSW